MVSRREKLEEEVRQQQEELKRMREAAAREKECLQRELAEHKARESEREQAMMQQLRLPTHKLPPLPPLAPVEQNGGSPSSSSSGPSVQLPPLPQKGLAGGESTPTPGALPADPCSVALEAAREPSRRERKEAKRLKKKEEEERKRMERREKREKERGAKKNGKVAAMASLSLPAAGTSAAGSSSSSSGNTKLSMINTGPPGSAPVRHIEGPLSGPILASVPLSPPRSSSSEVERGGFFERSKSKDIDLNEDEITRSKKRNLFKAKKATKKGELVRRSSGLSLNSKPYLSIWCVFAAWLLSLSPSLTGMR